MVEQHAKALVPEIRFAGFTDPWEQRKLGELCSFSKGYGYSKNNLRDQGTPIILYGRLYTNYETQIHSVDTFVDPLENSVYTEGGEVIVPASGETAEDISIASVVEKPGIILGGDLNIITPSAVVNPVFLALELSYGKPHFDLAKRAQGKSVVHIHNEDIANVFFDRPCIAEQRRIGGFFDRLDSLITLHQRKYDKLCVLKKSMLDKMFPKGGSVYPEIRFAGFTDPWEQRKLGEVAYGFEYGLNAAASDFDGEKKYLRITDIDDQTREFRTDDLSSPDINNPIDDKYLLKEGDILFARTGASVGKTYLYKASDGKTYYAGFLIRAHVSDEADAGFIFQSALTERYKQFVLITSQRSGQPGINAQEYADLLLLLPSLPEQRRIGGFFDRLDSLITLHQRKLELLRNIKKSMLNKMFV